jgi:hypothetical protein
MCNAVTFISNVTQYRYIAWRRISKPSPVFFSTMWLKHDDQLVRMHNDNWHYGTLRLHIRSLTNPDAIDASCSLRQCHAMQWQRTINAFYADYIVLHNHGQHNANIYIYKTAHFEEQFTFSLHNRFYTGGGGCWCNMNHIAAEVLRSNLWQRAYLCFRKWSIREIFFPAIRILF